MRIAPSQLENRWKYISLILFLFVQTAWTQTAHLNLYTWASDIPAAVIHLFEKETGIKVNHLSYDSNETMLAKILSTRKMQFDIIEPSNFYLERLVKKNLILTLDKTSFPEVSTLDKKFLDPQKILNAIPYFYGSTGILVNKKFHDPRKIQTWRDLWNPSYQRRLLLLNEPREVFSIALLSLGLDPNTNNPKDIQRAYKRIKQLYPNIKIFNSDAQVSFYIDEDLTLGMAWNSEAAKIIRNNPNLTFIYPKDGFMFYYDCFAIMKEAPNRKQAIQFLHFLLRPDIATKISVLTRYAITHRVARQHLPQSFRNNPISFPSKKTLQKAILQRPVDPKTLQQYGTLWRRLKLIH